MNAPNLWRKGSLRSREYREVVRAGRVMRRAPMTLYVRARPGPTRLGIGIRDRRAVVRNRARRRLRAAARAALPACGWEVAVIAEPGLLGRSFQEIVETLDSVAREAGD